MTEVFRLEGVQAPVQGGREGGPWSLVVPRGAFAAVQAAPSVADTVMRLAVGSAEPTAGTVEVLGTRPAGLRRFSRQALLRRLGVVFQREGLVSNLRVRDNLVMPLVYTAGYRRREARVLADAALLELGLASCAHRFPAALSREDRIVTALARAALREPELLLLEHLTAGLPGPVAGRALRWCRERSSTILVLVPGPSAILDGLVDTWLPPLEGTDEKGGA